MSVYALLDQMEGFISNSKRAFMQNDKIIVDADEMFALIDQLRTSLPDDLRDAQWVKKEEEQIKRKAQEEYERIIAEAQERVKAMVNETEIVRLAEIKAKEIVAEANETGKELTLGAFRYANDIMGKIENQLQIYYDVVQDGKDEIAKSIESLNQEN